MKGEPQSLANRGREEARVARLDYWAGLLEWAARKGKGGGHRDSTGEKGAGLWEGRWAYGEGKAMQAKRQGEREGKEFLFFFLNTFSKSNSIQIQTLAVLNQTTQLKNSNVAACMHKHVTRPYS